MANVAHNHVMDVFFHAKRLKVSPMRIPNRHIMYKRYTDGDITETEYKSYLAELEERERKASERFNSFVEGMVI